MKTCILTNSKADIAEKMIEAVVDSQSFARIICNK